MVADGMMARVLVTVGTLKFRFDIGTVEGFGSVMCDRPNPWNAVL